MSRGLLSSCLAWGPGSVGRALPVAFKESCHHSDGHNCFCRGGEHCIQPAKASELEGVTTAHTEKPYVLGCDGHLDGAEDVLLLDGHKKGLAGARCVSEYSPDMQIVVKDGHEDISMKLDGVEVDIIPRYPLRTFSEDALKELMKLNTHSFKVPTTKLYKRSEWLKIYKEEMHARYEEAMEKLHKVVEKVVDNEKKGEDEDDPIKDMNASMAGGLFAEEYAMVKQDCSHAAEIAQKICAEGDHCKPLNCFRGEEEEDKFNRFNQIVWESLERPGRHGMRRGLVEAGVREKSIDTASKDRVGVAVDVASRGCEAGGKVASEEHEYLRKHDTKEAREKGKKVQTTMGKARQEKEDTKAAADAVGQALVGMEVPPPLVLAAALLPRPPGAAAARQERGARRHRGQSFL